MSRLIREKCPKCNIIADQVITKGKKVTFKKCKWCNRSHSWTKTEEND